MPEDEREMSVIWDWPCQNMIFHYDISQAKKLDFKIKIYSLIKIVLRHGKSSGKLFSISGKYFLYPTCLLGKCLKCLMSTPDWSFVTCITNLGRIHKIFFKLSRSHKVKLLTQNAKNLDKSAILNIFSAIIEHVRELLISNMHNKFEQDTRKTFQVITPTMTNY